jgi:uncharacterized protein DUF1707
MCGMVNLPDGPDRRAELRASDADRERVAEILRTAAAEGRLDLDEVDERLALVYKAKTYAELEPLTRDLPVGHRPVAPVPAAPVRIGGPATSTAAIAVLGGFERKGAWVVPDVFTALALMGGGELDLRAAGFATAEVELRLFAVMGGIDVIVPEDAEVIVNGVGIMGGFDHQASGPGRPGAVRIKVTGLAFWGGVSVRRLPPKEELDRRRAQRRLERRQARLDRRERRRLGS